MPTNTLNELITTLGMIPCPRYSIEETAEILGLALKQVRTQIKKGRLTAIRGSRRRWTGVLHTDLEAFYNVINQGVL
jgi:hypothetical protein